jgi:hypothetical protein
MLAMTEIPSRWHIDQIATRERRLVDVPAHDLGKALVERLAEDARTIHNDATSQSVYEIGVQLSALAEWCGGTEGYGNMLLAQRINDLQAVAIAKLTADLDFPLEKCQELLAKIKEPWKKVDYRSRIMNREAGTEIFSMGLDEEGAGRIFASGQQLRMAQLNPTAVATARQLFPMTTFPESNAMKQRLDFFNDTPTEPTVPRTLRALWELKAHGMLVHGGFRSRHLDLVKGSLNN